MKEATLILEDKSQYKGYSFGYEQNREGEVVFNTGMVGYPQSITDPSYKGQILTFTYPLIGNYGIPRDEKSNNLSKSFESYKAHLSGLIVSNYSKSYSHWKAEKSLSHFLIEQKVPAITGIDTRALTIKLREKGVMLGRIVVGKIKNNDLEKKIKDPNEEDLVGMVQTPVTYEAGKGKKTILMMDCGMKNNIVHSFLKYNVKIKVVPSTHNISKEDFDGLFISNGPGDPSINKKAIENIKWAVGQKIPTFGICLGNQLLALAMGAKTYKLKYGHRSQNQPCLEIGTNRCYLTSQNHGFVVDRKTLPKGWKVWFENVNDKTVEGLIHESQKFFSVQFHPEATPGPVDTDWLFKKFVDNL